MTPLARCMVAKAISHHQRVKVSVENRSNSTLLKVKILYLEGDIICDMAKSATISSKGQITLPKELREKYHLKEGEEALILDSGDGILLKHGRTSLRGILKGKIDSKDFEEDLRKLRKEWNL